MFMMTCCVSLNLLYRFILYIFTSCRSGIRGCCALTDGLTMGDRNSQDDTDKNIEIWKIKRVRQLPLFPEHCVLVNQSFGIRPRKWHKYDQSYHASKGPSTDFLRVWKSQGDGVCY